MLRRLKSPASDEEEPVVAEEVIDKTMEGATTEDKPALEDAPVAEEKKEEGKEEAPAQEDAPAETIDASVAEKGEVAGTGAEAEKEEVKVDDAAVANDVEAAAENVDGAEEKKDVEKEAPGKDEANAGTVAQETHSPKKTRSAAKKRPSPEAQLKGSPKAKKASLKDDAAYDQVKENANPALDVN